ncbi:hypothetical protein DINM_006316 [Dirofilaria immitis]|nr:hypothetical protein [Dirofilaria immitis]
MTGSIHGAFLFGKNSSIRPPLCSMFIDLCGIAHLTRTSECGPLKPLDVDIGQKFIELIYCEKCLKVAFEELRRYFSPAWLSDETFVNNEQLFKCCLVYRVENRKDHLDVHSSQQQLIWDRYTQNYQNFPSHNKNMPLLTEKEHRNSTK